MIRFGKLGFNINNKDILKEISFKIDAGEKVSFTGPSGSGKSTILRTIIGAIIPSEGTYYFRNKRVNHKNISEIRQKIAYVGQEPVLSAEIVKDALLLPFTFKAHKHRIPQTKQINTLLETFYLEPSILKQRVSRISGGEKQRVALARALLMGKKIFLLDEVTSALDPESREAVSRALYKPEYTLISISHDKEWIQQSSRIITIEKGRIVGDSDADK